MSRKGLLAIAAVAGLSLLGLPLFMTSQPVSPVSVIFLGYTNPPPNSEMAATIGSEREAVFRLTNRTGLRIGCEFEVEGTNRTSGLTTFASQCSELLSHACRDVSVVSPGGTKGWRFETLLLCSTARPYWQYRVHSILRQIGVHETRLGLDKPFPQLTNVWATP
jgi:hypothetical protein